VDCFAPFFGPALDLISGKRLTCKSVDGCRSDVSIGSNETPWKATPMMNEPKQPCGNCGSKAFVPTVGTDPSDGSEFRFALIAIGMKNGRLAPKLNSGLRVDVYVCENCGAVQLFAIVGKVGLIQ